MNYLIVPKIVFLLLASSTLCLANNYKIIANILGVENVSLTYREDYHINLLGDGREIRWDKYEIEKGENKLIIKIHSEEKYRSFRLEISADGYRDYSKNISISSFDNSQVNLGKLKLRPLDFMINQVLIYSDERMEGYLNFELTFRNNHSKEILIKNLNINLNTTVNCLFPTYLFAHIIINEDVIIQNNQYKSESETQIKGTFSVEKQKLSLLDGVIHYEGCGRRTIDLNLPVSLIVPASKYSKLRFSIPNQIKSYTRTSESIDSLGFDEYLSFIDEREKKQKETSSYGLSTIESVIKGMHQINFTVTTDLKDYSIVNRSFEFY